MGYTVVEFIVVTVGDKWKESCMKWEDKTVVDIFERRDEIYAGRVASMELHVRDCLKEITLLLEAITKSFRTTSTRKKTQVFNWTKRECIMESLPKSGVLLLQHPWSENMACGVNNSLVEELPYLRSLDLIKGIWNLHNIESQLIKETKRDREQYKKVMKKGECEGIWAGVTMDWEIVYEAQ